jgi:glycerol-3-phosphate acyltransferase PlsY
MLWAAVVLILDVGRALAIGAAALYFLDTSLVPWVGLALIIGNRYPCFHGFRGGKGVASYLGFGAALSPISSMLSCIVWVILFSIIRIPFIASAGNRQPSQVFSQRHCSYFTITKRILRH